MERDGTVKDTFLAPFFKNPRSDFLIRFFGVFLVTVYAVAVMVFLRAEICEYNYSPYKRVKVKRPAIRVVAKKRRKAVVDPDRVAKDELLETYYIPDTEFKLTKYYVKRLQKEDRLMLRKQVRQHEKNMDLMEIPVRKEVQRVAEEKIQKIQEKLAEEKRKTDAKNEKKVKLANKMKFEEEQKKIELEVKKKDELEETKKTKTKTEDDGAFYDEEPTSKGQKNRMEKSMVSEQTSQGPAKDRKVNTEQVSKPKKTLMEEQPSRGLKKAMAVGMLSEQTSQGPLKDGKMNTEQVSKPKKTLVDEPPTRGLKKAMPPKTASMFSEQTSQGPLTNRKMSTEPISKAKKTSMDEPPTRGLKKSIPSKPMPSGNSLKTPPSKPSSFETRKRKKEKKKDTALLMEAKTQTLSLDDNNLEPKTMLEAKTKKLEKKKLEISPQKTQGTLEDSPTKKSSVIRYRQPGQDFHHKALKEQEHELTDGFVEEVVKLRQSNKKKRKEEAEKKRLEEEQAAKMLEQKTKTKVEKTKERKKK